MDLSRVPFIQTKIVGKAASTEWHRSSERIVNMELKLLRYMCSIPLQAWGIWGGFVGSFCFARQSFAWVQTSHQRRQSHPPCGSVFLGIYLQWDWSLCITLSHTPSGAAWGTDWDKSRTTARVAQTQTGSSQLWNCCVWRAKPKHLYCLTSERGIWGCEVEGTMVQLLQCDLGLVLQSPLCAVFNDSGDCIPTSRSTCTGASYVAM